MLLTMQSVVLSFLVPAPPKPVQPVIGVDYGLRRVGVAIGIGLAAAQPYPVLWHPGDDQELCEALVRVAIGEQASTFVVGLPKNKKNEETAMSNATRQFAAMLLDEAKKEFGSDATVFLFDERFTSKEAYALVAHDGKRPQYVDSIAACLIIEDFFEQKGKGSERVRTSSTPPTPPKRGGPKKKPPPKTVPNLRPGLRRYVDEGSRGSE